MMPHQEHNNNILLLITGFVIQAGVWITDQFAHLSFTGIYDNIYDGLKVVALSVSIWASYRVGKKNPKQ